MSDITADGGAAAEPTKATLRAAARAQRQLLDEAERAALAPAWSAQVLSLPATATAGTVAAYLSYGVEPPTTVLIDVLRERGVRVLLPVLQDDKDLDWTDGSDAALGVDAIRSADVVVVPALLVDTTGARLGQGGGSYDRALRRIRPGTPLVALVHDDELVEAGAVPTEPHDVRVTHVATPTGLVALPLTDHA